MRIRPEEVLPLSTREVLALEPGVVRPAVAFLAGSRVDGYGNSSSDVDIYVIGACRPSGADAFQHGQYQVSPHVVDSIRYDFRFWGAPAVANAIEKLARCKPEMKRRDLVLTHDELTLLHALVGGLSLVGTLDEWRCLVDDKKLAELHRQMAIRRLDEAFDDVEGSSRDAAIVPCVLRCRALLDAALDVFRFGRGATNPRGKAAYADMVRQGADSTLDQYLRLVEAVPLNAPLKDVRCYAERCMRFANLACVTTDPLPDA